MEIGLLEFNESMWPSLERTKSFYLNAIAAAYKTSPVTFDENGNISKVPDAIVNFMGNKGWELKYHPDCPLIFGIHGGAILNQSFLRDHLGKLRTSDVLVVNCQSDIDILRNMFKVPPLFCHLPLPVDTACFKQLSGPGARKKLSLKDDDLVLGFVGRLLPQKNLHRYLEFLARLKSRFYPRKIKGIVIGKYWIDYTILNYEGGHYPHYIQELITRNGLQNDLLYFPANLSNEDLATCYNAMDLLIHPTNSIDENFGYAPVEAMACGTPVMGAAYGGLKDTIISGRTGFLMPTWVTEAGIRMDTYSGLQFATALLSNEALKKEMATEAFNHAQSFCAERCSSILCDAIAGAVKKNSAGATQNVQLNAYVPSGTTDKYLPSINQPWEKYKEPVRYYVSTTCDDLNEHAIVYPAASIIAVQDDNYKLDDPTWPATYHLNGQQKKIIELCRHPAKVADLLYNGHANMKELKKLVDMGTLCYSQYNAS